MKRIAFFGPLPPSNTGIADYNFALLPLLRKDYEIDVYLPDSNTATEGFHHGDFFFRHKARPYDLNLYQMGNQPHFHEYMYGYLFQQPGAVMFHDYCLHHSRADMLLKRNMTEEYREELRYIYPEQAEKIANASITFSAGSLLFFHFPLFELVARVSLAAAGHTDHALQKLRISNTPVIKIPHLKLEGGRDSNPLPASPFIGGKGQSDKLLLGKKVVASFGYATEAKRISTILEAFAAIRPEYPDLLYVIVGNVEDPVGLQAQIETLGIRESVLVTGHTEMSEFLAWMARADIIVNLRYPSAGEMSGTLIRSLASGKPVIISRLQNLQEIPEDAVLRVRPDHEKEDLLRALSALLEDRNLRDRLSLRAKKFMDENHNPEKVREGYKKLIETALQRKSQYVPPELPLHLRTGEEVLRNRLLKTSFAGVDPKILEFLNRR